VDVGPGTELGGLISGAVELVDAACGLPIVVLDPAGAFGKELVVAGAPVMVDTLDVWVSTGAEPRLDCGAVDVVSDDEPPSLQDPIVSVNSEARAAAILTVTWSSMSPVGGLVASPPKTVIRHLRDGKCP
jgi:hypothetical protein